MPVVGFKFRLLESVFKHQHWLFIVLMVYVARYLAKVSDKEYSFKDSLLELWLPVAAILILILPANFSNNSIDFSMVCMLVFIGQYPMRYLGIIIGAGIVSLTMFVLVAKLSRSIMPNRVDTWMSRIDSFDDKPNEDDYQIEKAKIAIASGKIYGLEIQEKCAKNCL